MAYIKRLMEEIAYLHQEGLTNEQIASKLECSIDTIKCALMTYADLMEGEA